MEKYLTYHFKCPVCGLLSSTNNLYRDFKFECFRMRGLGRGKGFIKTPCLIDADFRLAFREHILTAVLDLASNGLLDLSWFKKELNRPVIPLIYRGRIGSDDFDKGHALGSDNFKDINAETTYSEDW